MRIDFKILLCSIILLASCQSRLTFEGRRYTKGVYWNVSHVKPKQQNRYLHLNTKPAETAVDHANQDIKPQASLINNPEVLKPNTQQTNQVIKNELVFKNYKNPKMLFNTKPHFNAQSKKFKNSKINSTRLCKT